MKKDEQKRTCYYCEMPCYGIIYHRSASNEAYFMCPFINDYIPVQLILDVKKRKQLSIPKCARMSTDAKNIKLAFADFILEIKEKFGGGKCDEEFIMKILTDYVCNLSKKR